MTRNIKDIRLGFRHPRSFRSPTPAPGQDLCGVVNVIANGNDPYSCIPEILRLHKAAGVAAGETGKVLHHQKVDFVGHHVPAHLLVVFPGLAGIPPCLISAVILERNWVRETVTGRRNPDRLFYIIVKADCWTNALMMIFRISISWQRDFVSTSKVVVASLTK